MPDAPPRELSMREREILAAAARGLGVSETGRQLYLSPNTVKTYRRTAFRLLGARNVTEAVALAQASGLLQPEVPASRSPVTSGRRAG